MLRLLYSTISKEKKKSKVPRIQDNCREIIIPFLWCSCFWIKGLYIPQSSNLIMGCDGGNDFEIL